VEYLNAEQKADMNVQGNDGNTPLHIASLNNALEVVKYLSGMEKVTIGVLNKTASCCQYECIGTLEVVIYLVGPQEVEINVKDINGHTPVDLASMNNASDVEIYFKYFQTGFTAQH
jgi:ankyrin repeat protein